eukprot:scaffold5302_cov174-Isochrysis_galbana.AAC.3
MIERRLSGGTTMMDALTHSLISLARMFKFFCSCPLLYVALCLFLARWGLGLGPYLPSLSLLTLGHTCPPPRHTCHIVANHRGSCYPATLGP